MTSPPASASASAPADFKALSFEQALAELEKIVAELASGQAPLERSIEMYGAPIRLSSPSAAGRRRPTDPRAAAGRSG